MYLVAGNCNVDELAKKEYCDDRGAHMIAQMNVMPCHVKKKKEYCDEVHL